MELLIIRSLQGLTSAEEEEQLRRWRSLHAANERTYRSLSELWRLTGLTAMAEDSAERPPPIDHLIARAEAHRAAGTRGPGNIRRFRPDAWSVLRVAAMAVLFIPLGFGLSSFIGETDTRVMGPLATSEIRTGAGEMTTVALDDGTTIRVGPRSRIRLTETAAGRIAELSGRAFFAVEPGSDRTFTVRTPHGEALVLGTRFEVRSESDEFRVLVVEGTVRVLAGIDDIELSRDQLGRSRGAAPLSVENLDDAFAHLEWMGRSLVFQATPLRQALAEVERRYPVSVEYVAPELESLSISATFTDDEVEDVLAVLCEITGAECTIDERGGVRMGAGRPLS